MKYILEDQIIVALGQVCSMVGTRQEDFDLIVRRIKSLDGINIIPCMYCANFSGNNDEGDDEGVCTNGMFKTNKYGYCNEGASR